MEHERKICLDRKTDVLEGSLLFQKYQQVRYMLCPTLRYLHSGAGIRLFMSKDLIPMSVDTTSRCPSVSSACIHTSIDRDAKSPHAGIIRSVSSTGFPKSNTTNLRAPVTIACEHYFRVFYAEILPGLITVRNEVAAR